MNLYQLLKLNRVIKNPRVKFLGLYFLHKTNQRYLSINFDPVMACNLRCKMCYFTDENYVRKIKGIFPENELEPLAKSIFKRAIKLQVGCGTEPTLYKHLDKVFELGKKYKVPNISITTNANLLNEEKVKIWVENGLKEFIISLHGVHKKDYEFFMGKASYEKFHNALGVIYNIKQLNPEVKLRINYTFNKDNFHVLEDFFDVYGKYGPDVLQIRPMKNMGNTDYSDTDISSLEQDYDEIISKLLKEGKKRNMVILGSPNFSSLTKTSNIQSVIYKSVYCYIRPGYVWREGFNFKNESFNQFAKKIGWGKNLRNRIFVKPQEYQTLETQTSLKYEVIN